MNEHIQHGRLVARLQRQVRKCDELGVTPARRRKVLRTVHALVLLERRMTDPLDPDKTVTWEQMRERIDLMKPGAGIEVAA